MKITIIIPTWNRKQFLEASISRIINLINSNKIKDLCIRLYIFNNASTDETALYLKSVINNNSESKIHFFNSAFHSDGGFSIYQAILYGSSDSDWVWLHGDDDIISDSITPEILYNTLLYANKIHAKTIVACARESLNPNFMDKISLKLGNACNEYGFINTLGWISGLIFSPKHVLSNYFLQSNKVYWQSPYAHSFIIFKTYYNNISLIWNSNVINPQAARKQNEIDERWNSENVLERFRYILPSFLNLFNEHKEFKPEKNFFRMHTWSYISFITNQIYINILNKSQSGRSHELMECIIKMIPYVKNTNSSNELRQNIDFIRSILNDASAHSSINLASLRFPPSLIV
jgi:glycosyltransferase involved in cell wall biosynthesis